MVIPSSENRFAEDGVTVNSPRIWQFLVAVMVFVFGRHGLWPTSSNPFLHDNFTGV